jgi:hypothetical protein
VVCGVVRVVEDDGVSEGGAFVDSGFNNSGRSVYGQNTHKHQNRYLQKAHLH